MRLTFPIFYKFLTIFFGALLLAFSAQAQLSFDLSWRQGKVVLASGDTLFGAVTLRHPDGILIVSQQDGAVSTFSPVGVQYFEVNGEKDTGLFRRNNSPSTLSRRYQTVMWNFDKDYSNFKAPAFFVVLQPGKYSLLMREIKVRQYSNSSYGYYGGARIMQEHIEEKFYLQLPNQELRPLRNPKKDLQAIFPKQAKQITAYAKENNLNFNDPFGLSHIIKYVNSL